MIKFIIVSFIILAVGFLGLAIFCEIKDYLKILNMK